LGFSTFDDGRFAKNIDRFSYRDALIARNVLNVTKDDREGFPNEITGATPGGVHKKFSEDHALVAADKNTAKKDYKKEDKALVKLGENDSIPYFSYQKAIVEANLSEAHRTELATLRQQPDAKFSRDIKQLRRVSIYGKKKEPRAEDVSYFIDRRTYSARLNDYLQLCTKHIERALTHTTNL